MASPGIFRCQNRKAYGNYHKRRSRKDDHGDANEEYRHPEYEYYYASREPDHAQILANFFDDIDKINAIILMELWFSLADLLSESPPMNNAKFAGIQTE